MNYQDYRMFQELPQGEMDVLGLFYAQHRTRFVSWLSHKYQFSTEDAQDIFTDATIIIFEKISNGKLTVEKMSARLETFLYSIGKYLSTDKLRKEGRRQRILQLIAERSQEAYSPDLDQDMKEEFQMKWGMIADAIDKLPAKQQQLLHLFYYEKKSHDEIAEILGYANADSAKRAKHSCMQKLRRQFNK